MNEEVADKTIRLAITAGRITGRVLCRGIGRYIRRLKRKVTNLKQEQSHGKQSVKKLVGQGQGVSTMEIEDSSARDFFKIAKKYGVDYAVTKDVTGEQPRYTVFFKAKDAEVLTIIFKEYAAKQMKKQKQKEAREERVERVSVLEKLRKIKEDLLKHVKKDKERKKELER